LILREFNLGKKRDPDQMVSCLNDREVIMTVKIRYTITSMIGVREMRPSFRKLRIAISTAIRQKVIPLIDIIMKVISRHLNLYSRN
jgi:hypothetical protein